MNNEITEKNINELAPLNLEQCVQFIKTQYKNEKEQALLKIEDGQAFEEVEEYIETVFLSECDVSDYCEEEIVEEVQLLRGDACNDLVREIESIFSGKEKP